MGSICKNLPAISVVIGLLAALALQLPSQAKGLLGKVDGDIYYHVSGAFKVKTPGGKISDSQADVNFTYTMFQAITGWHQVALMKPELTSGKTPKEIIEVFVAGLSKKVYKRKKEKPSILVTQKSMALGKGALYAKVLFPEYPGTGMTVITSKGQKDADFIGHFHLIPIGKLNLLQRGLPIKYLFVSSMKAKQMEGEDVTRHKEFLKGVELTSASVSK